MSEAVGIVTEEGPLTFLVKGAAGGRQKKFTWWKKWTWGWRGCLDSKKSSLSENSWATFFFNSRGPSIIFIKRSWSSPIFIQDSIRKESRLQLSPQSTVSFLKVFQFHVFNIPTAILTRLHNGGNKAKLRRRSWLIPYVHSSLFSRTGLISSKFEQIFIKIRYRRKVILIKCFRNILRTEKWNSNLPFENEAFLSWFKRRRGQRKWKGPFDGSKKGCSQVRLYPRWLDTGESKWKFGALGDTWWKLRA